MVNTMRKLMLILMLVLCISSVQAQIQASPVELGGTDQDRGVRTSTTITITNTHSTALTDFTVTVNEVDEIFATTADLSGTSAAENDSIEMTVSGFVPLDLDAVDSRGRKIAFDIGDVIIEAKDTNGDTFTTTVELVMEAENKLEFGSDSDVMIEDTTRSLREGRDYEAKRDDDVTITIEAENNFDDDGDCDEGTGDCDIEDIEVILEQDDLDIDEDMDMGTLRADDTETDSFSFRIPDDADDDDYEVDMWITGEDENGALHGERVTFTFEVQVPRDEVLITDFSLFPDRVSCDPERATLTVTLENTGRDDQEDVVLEVISTSLDISEAAFNIDLDEGDETIREFSFDIPGNLTQGEYYIQMISYTEDNDESDRQIAVLTASECRTQDDQEQEEEEDNDGSIDVIEAPPTGNVIVGTPRQDATFTSTQYMILIGVLAFIALLLFALLIALLVR